MEPIQKEPTLEESVKQIMPSLPSPVRNYLAQRKHSVVAANLMRKYGLHIDQGGVIEREIMLLLMGIESPEDFAQSLKDDAELPESMLGSVVADINQELLTPLREELRRGGPAAVVPGKVPEAKPAETNPAAPSTPPAAVPASATIQPVRITAPTAPMPPGVAPLPPKVIMPGIRAISHAPLPKPAENIKPLNPAPAGSGERFGTQNVLADHLLPIGEDQSVSTPKAPDSAATPPRKVLNVLAPDYVAPAPRSVIPPDSAPAGPVHLPGTNIPVPGQPPAPALAQAPTQQAAQQQPSTPSTPPRAPTQSGSLPPKPYASDPYREPIE